MRIIITRHGETNANKAALACGWYNSRLSKEGKEQAIKLANRLDKEEIDRIFCSDLLRCRQTISPYLAKHPVEIHYTSLLREQSYGVFEGKSNAKMIEWFKNNPGKGLEGGETKEQLRKRLREFLFKVLPKYKENNLLIVTHGRAKATILEILFGENEEHMEKIKGRIPNTAVTVIELWDYSNPILRLLNCDKHLHSKSQETIKK